MDTEATKKTNTESGAPLKELLTPTAVERLLAWYRAQHRDLPWRKTQDPYRIWISEIMLQQTRVEAVKPYYARFLDAAPDVSALAALEDERLMKLWEGLGYYSRARNLKRAAIKIMTEHGGVFPDTYEELLALPGVGAYTAGAIASIAYGLRVPAVDGNVLRVLSRVKGSFCDVLDERTKKAFASELSTVLPQEAGDFTQSMIELGATLCGPNGEALCSACPFCDVCVAHRQGLCDRLPVRRAKKERRIEERTVFLIRDGERTVLHKRPPKGLLAGLFELPNVRGHMREDEAIAYVVSLGMSPLRIRRIHDAKHIFTHIEWHMIAYDVLIAYDFDGIDTSGGMLLIDNGDLHKEYAVPSAFSAYTEELQSSKYEEDKP